LWPRAGGGPSRLVTRGARLAHPRFFPLRRLRQLGGFLAQGAPGGHTDTAYRRRTPALPLKEDCQIVNRQWFAACGVKEVEEREGGPVQGHSPPPPPPPRGAKLWRRRRWRRRQRQRQRRRRRSPSDPDLGPNGGGCSGGDPLREDWDGSYKCLGTTCNQAVPIRADWGCPLVQRGAQRVPYQTPSRSSLAPSAGLAVAGPVIWRSPSFGGGPPSLGGRTRRTTRKR
jgi:hypothetical protein